METEDNNINIEPSKDEIVVPQNIIYQILDKSARIKNSSIRNRVYVNMFSAIAGKMILKNYDIESNISFGLQQIMAIISKWDISELFVGLCRVSVRHVFGEYKPFIPKKHEKYGLFGHLFMFIRIDENYNAKLLGFLPQKDLNKTNSDDENYYVEIEELKNLDEIKDCFKIKPEIENISELKKERKQIIHYFEGKIDDKIAFFRMLAKSRYLREEMIKYESAQMIFSEMIKRETDIKKELERDMDKISQLADAFIQSKNQILTHSAESAESFKLECTRANLEKLFNTPSFSVEKNIENKSSEEVMDILLTKSEYTIKDDKLPIGVLRFLVSFFIFFVLFFVFLLYLNSTGLFNYNYGIKSNTKINIINKITNSIYFNKTKDLINVYQ